MGEATLRRVTVKARADCKSFFYIRMRNSASDIRKTASVAKWKLAALCA